MSLSITYIYVYQIVIFLVVTNVPLQLLLFPLILVTVNCNRLKDQRERALQRFEEEKELASRKLVDSKNRLESLQSELVDRQVGFILACVYLSFSPVFALFS